MENEEKNGTKSKSFFCFFFGLGERSDAFRLIEVCEDSRPMIIYPVDKYYFCIEKDEGQEVLVEYKERPSESIQSISSQINTKDAVQYPKTAILK